MIHMLMKNVSPDLKDFDAEGWIIIFNFFLDAWPVLIIEMVEWIKGKKN